MDKGNKRKKSQERVKSGAPQKPDVMEINKQPAESAKKMRRISEY